MSEHHERFEYFVDGLKYETDKSSLTGAEIKASVPNLNPTYKLFLEVSGDAPDREIADSETVTIDPGHGHGVRHFFAVPPATFGC
jgi:hypothetical protein